MNASSPEPENGNLERHVLHGIAATFPAINIDTDAIFPKQYLTTIKRSGLEDALFADWRADENGTMDADFVLNKPDFRCAKILIAGDNFGCGSSREHAVWALNDFGIKALISTSFGSIFQINCIKNGVWPLTVGEADLVRLMERFRDEPARSLTIDLTNVLVIPDDGIPIRAHISASDHANLLSGRDEIDRTLTRSDAIEAFEHRQAKQFPWLAPKVTTDRHRASFVNLSS